jgi:hypothetical protein
MMNNVQAQFIVVFRYTVLFSIVNRIWKNQIFSVEDNDDDLEVYEKHSNTTTQRRAQQ